MQHHNSMKLAESASPKGRNPSVLNVEDELEGLMGLPLSPKANNMASDLVLIFLPGDEGTTGSKDELGEKWSSGR